MKGTLVPSVAARGRALCGCGAHGCLAWGGGDRSSSLGQAAVGLFEFEEERRRLAARAHAELGEGGGEVALDRALGEEELVGDLGVGQALGDVGEDLALAVGEGRALDAGTQLARDDRLAASRRR